MTNQRGRMKIEKAWERKFGKENLRGREKMKEYKRMRKSKRDMIYKWRLREEM